MPPLNDRGAEARRARRYLRRRRALLVVCFAAAVVVGVVRARSLAALADEHHACHRAPHTVDAHVHDDHAIRRILASGLTPLAVYPDRAAPNGSVAIAVCDDEGVAFTTTFEDAR